MLRKFTLIILALFLTQASSVFALDWKSLHQRSDQMNLQQAEELLKANLGSLEALYIYALVCLNKHEDNQAKDIFGQMLKIDPQLEEGKWGKAEVLRRQRKLEESEKLLNEVIDSDSDFSPAYISLAYIKYTQLDFKESLRLAYKVKKQGRDKVDLSNYVRAYLLIGGNKGMLAYYGGPLAKMFNGMAVFPNLKKAEQLQPDSPAVLFGLGSFYFLSPAIIGGDIDKAESYLKAAIAADPLFADAYVRLAQVYKMKGDNEKYANLLKKAKEIDPQNELALDAESGKCAFICISIKE